MSTAVIDIGTNTLLLLIVDDKGKAIVDLARFGRLGQGLDKTGRLAPEAIERSLAICREYRGVMDEHGIETPTVIATQATREAANASEFVVPAEEILRARFQVIAGTREAELAFKSVAASLEGLAGLPYVVVDVGGGSTELIVTDGARVVSAVSVPIGAVRMTERHLAHDPPTGEEIRRLSEDVDRHLAPLELPASVPVVGTAGTATTIAAVHLGLSPYDPNRVTGLSLAPSAVDALLARLLASTIAERKQIVGMEPQRADVICGGVAIFSRVMRRIAAPALITCDRGIRWGVAYEQLGLA